MEEKSNDGGEDNKSKAEVIVEHASHPVWESDDEKGDDAWNEEHGHFESEAEESSVADEVEVFDHADELGGHFEVWSETCFFFWAGEEARVK